MNPDETLLKRAGRLREEFYPAWYAQFRKGARLRLVANSLEFQDALSLVKTWDDERLYQLAQCVLTTNDPFITGTDRSFKIFALKASWADDRLRHGGDAARWVPTTAAPRLPGVSVQCPHDPTCGTRSACVERELREARIARGETS